MGFNRNFRFLIDISGNLTPVEFGGIFWLVEFSGFLRYRVDFNGNLRLVGLSGFLRLQFRVRTIYYRVFLFVTGGSK